MHLKMLSAKWRPFCRGMGGGELSEWLQSSNFQRVTFGDRSDLLCWRAEWSCCSGAMAAAYVQSESWLLLWYAEFGPSVLPGPHVVWAVSLEFHVNTLRPRQNGRHFADDIFKCIFLNENVWISIKISLKFVPKGPINNIPALVQIMAWRRPGAKPLSEPMMVNLPTHICDSRPQWVNIITMMGRHIICQFALMCLPDSWS